MECSQTELRSENTALTRRRDPLLAHLAWSELPYSIRRPAQGAAGRGAISALGMRET